MGQGIARASAVIAIAAWACSGSGSEAGNGDGGGGVTTDQACSDFASALCAKIQACSTFYFQLTYADMTACTTGTKTTCVNTLGASGTGQTPSNLASCVQSIPGVSCDDALSNTPPAACQPAAGQLANGTPCGDDSQCQSAYCNKGTNGTCGACGTRAASGAACTRDDDCPFGNVCHCAGGSPCANNGGACIALGDSGATCDASTQPCKRTLACKSGTCALPDEMGMPCTVGNAANPFGSCDVAAGLVCNPLSKTCATIGLAAAGGACGLMSGGITVCSASGTCAPPMRATGTCSAAAGNGGSCSATARCVPPANCTNGVCTLPDPSSCH